MTDMTAYAAIILTILALLFLAASVISKAVLNGSLQKDVSWIKRTVRIHARHAKTWLINN